MKQKHQSQKFSTKTPSDAPREDICREINGKQYTILLNRLAPFTPIRLENSEWQGVVYHYGRTKLLEENDCLRLSFEYYLLENGDLVKPEDAGRFLQHIGDILVDIMDRNLSEDASTIPIMSQNEIGYLAN